MSDNSLPYLVEVTITPPSASYNHTGDLIVGFTVRWKVGAIRPDLVEIYRQFGSDSELLDLGNRIAIEPTDQSLVTLSIPAFDRIPSLYLGVAPRTVVDGSTTETMVDASGEPQPWDQFATEGGYSIAYPPAPPSSLFPPPKVEVSSSVKTLTSNDQINITVIATIASVDQYQVIVNFKGDDLPQLNSNDPWFSIPSVPGGVYTVKAQQRGVNFNGDPWSAWCAPVPYVASQRARSLRVFLNNSGVLKSGVTVRQYAQNDKGSTRSMMGL